MAYTEIQEPYTKTAPVQLTADFFDQIEDTNLINMYLLGLVDSTGDIFSLTTNVSTASHESNLISGNAGSTLDIDFDLDINTPFTIVARQAIINYYGQTITDGTATWTLRHVDAASVETDIGTVISDTITSSNEGKKTHKFTCTKQRFTKGDKLRINVVTSHATIKIAHDPSGRQTFVEQSTSPVTVTGQATLSVPIEIDT